VIKSTVFMMMSTLARLLSSVLLFIVMARVWGAEIFGVFAYPLAVATVAIMVLDYGFGLQVVKSIGGRHDRARDVMQRALAGKWVLSIVVTVGALVATPWLADGTSTLALTWLLLLSSLVGSFALLLNLPFRGTGRFEEETKVVVLASLVHFAIVVVALELGASPVVVAACFVLSRVCYLLLSLSAYRRLVGRIDWTSFDPRSGLVMLREGLPYGVFVAMGTLYFQIDTLLVQHFLGPRGVGLFQAGVRLLMGALILPDVVCNVYLPAIANVVGHSADETARLGTRMTRQLLMFGVAGLITFWLGAQEIVGVLYGRDYEAVVTLLPAFGLVLLLRFVASSYGLLLTVGDRQVTRTIVVSGAFLVSLVVNVLLIPRYGLRGAVLASVVTHAFLLFAYLCFVVHDLGGWFFDPRNMALLALVAVAAVIATQNPLIRLGGGFMIIVATLAAGVKWSEWKSLVRTMPSLAADIGPP